MLRLLRRRARLTQAELSIAVGYSDAQICRLETGRRPPDLTALAALFLPALGVDTQAEDGRRLLALAALARAESELLPHRPAQRMVPAQPAQPIEDYGVLLDQCIGLAEESEDTLGWGGDQEVWSERLEAEHDRMRIALGWAQARSDLRGLRLATALWRFWYMRGYLREGRRWVEVFLALPNAASDPVAFVRALNAGGILAWRQGDYAQAEKWYLQSLALVRELPEQPDLGRLLLRLGLLFVERGSIARAQAYFEESLAVNRATGDERTEVAILHNLGNMYNQQNENERAMEYYEACLTIYEQIGDTNGVALIELGIGTIARDSGDLRRALAAFTHSHAESHRVGDHWTAAVALQNLGDIAADRRDFPVARGYFAEAETIFRQIGDQQQLAMVDIRHATAELLDGRLGLAITLFRQGLMQASGIGFLPGIAEALEGLGACTAIQHPSLTVRLLAAASAIRAEVGIPITKGDAHRHETLVARTRRAAGQAAWERDWATGALLTPSEATALALANVHE